MDSIKSKTLKKKEYLFAGEVSELTGISKTTLRYYTEIGLLSYVQTEDGARRRYIKDEVLKKLKEIERLKKRRFTLEEIKEKLIPKLGE